MIVIEFIAELFMEIIIEGVILGIYRLIKKCVQFIRVKIFKIEPKTIRNSHLKTKATIEKKELIK